MANKRYKASSKYNLGQSIRKGQLKKQINFSTLSNDIDTLNKSLKDSSSTWQTQETMKNTLDSVKSMQTRINAYEEYRKNYAGTTVNLPDLTELKSNYSDIVSGWGELTDKYKNFENADAYNKSVKEYEGMTTADLGKIKNEIKTLEGYDKKAKDYLSQIESINSTTSNTIGVGGSISAMNATDKVQKELNKYLNSIGYKSYDDLKKALGNKKVYLNNASRLQEGIKLGSVGDINSEFYDPNYDKYVAIGKSINPEEVGTELTSYRVRNRKGHKTTTKSEDKLAAEALQAFLKGTKSGSSEAYYSKGAVFDLMTEKEFNDVAYYLAKDQEDGGNRTEQYVESIKESLNQRRGKEIAESIDGTWRQGVFAFTAGLDQFATGWTNAFSDADYIPVNQIQSASSEIREDIYEDSGWWARAGYDLANTTANMLPSILMSSVANYAIPGSGAVVGAAMMGVSASGNAYQEMVNLGYDKDQARAYQVLVGASEAGLQYALGGIGKLGGTSKWLSKAVTGIDNGLARFAIRWGGSMLSEGFEEAAQEVLTPIFMSAAAGYDTGAEIDWSEVAYSGLLGALSGGLMEGGGIATNSISEHYSNKIAGQNIKDNARVDSVFKMAEFSPEESLAYEAYTKYAKKGINAENVSDARLGRLAMLEGMDAQEVLDSKSSTAEERKAAHKKNFKLDEYSKYNPGSEGSRHRRTYEGKENKDTASMLIDTALTYAEDTDAYKIAKELQGKKKITNDDAIRLTKAMDKAERAEIKSSATEKLTELGEGEEASKIADIIVKKAMGDTLTKGEESALENSTYGNQVYDQIIEEGVSGEESADADAEVISETSSKLVEGGASEEVASLVAQKMRGESISTEDAEKIVSSEIEVPESNVGTLISNAKAMDKKMGAAYVSVYDGKADVEAYTNAFNLVWEKSSLNFTFDNILKSKGVLTATQAGKIYAEARINADKEKTAQFRKIVEKTAKMKAYKGKIDDSVIDYENKSTKGKVNWNSLTSRQRDAITFIKGFAEATGLNLIFITDGEARGMNGAFDVEKNIIYVDVFAEMVDTDTRKIVDSLIPTLSHELTHWMKDKSPELYRKLNNIVFSTLEKHDGLSEDARIANEIVRLLARDYKTKYESENPGKTISIEEAKKKLTEEEIKEALKDSKMNNDAREEIVARACEDMLSKSKVGKELFAQFSVKEKKTIGDIVKDLIQKLKDWASELLGLYKSDRYEAQVMRMFDERLDALSKAWDEMLLDSVEVNQAMEKSKEDATKESATEVEDASADGEITSIGSYDLTELSEAVDEDGKMMFQYRAIEADKDIYREMLLKHKDTIGITNKQINDLFTMIDKAVEIITKDELSLEALDYSWDADINDRAFNPVKPNSDSLYKVSLDFSTLCRKRLLQQTIQRTLQEALNKNLSKEESIAIRDELMKLQEEGRKIEIACALCYVEAARMKSPVQINKFLNNKETIIKDFYASKDEATRKKIDEAALKARETLAKRNPKGLKGKNNATLDALTASLNSMYAKDANFIRDAKKAVIAEYKPTEAQSKEIGAALNMSAVDFTSAEGLENLAKKHPDIFDAYTSFVRNATHSKGLESDVWWRAGDSEFIGDNLIAQMNEENGLRSQSWSDFQVIHLLDYIAATIELSAKGAKRQSYTKVPDYVKLLGNTGDMINMSIIPERAFSGKLGFDAVEGMAYEVALKLREEYHKTAGTISIGINDAQIRLLLEDTNIDMVIPYHASGMSKVVKKLMHIPEWESYQSYQSESKLKDTEARANAEKYGMELKKGDKLYQKAPKFSEWFDIAEARQIAEYENKNPSNKELKKKYGVMYGGYMAMQNAANTYLKLCAERGLAPKFSHEKADFTNDANYWKLLIDRKMVDNVTGEVIEQQAIKPIFKEESVLEILNDESERFNKKNEDIRYSERTDTNIYDIMGENKRLEKRNARLEADIARLKEMWSIDKKVTHRTAYDSKNLLSVAKYVKETFNSDMDKVELARMLGDTYTAIAEQLNKNYAALPWQTVYDYCYNTAYEVVEKAKPRVVVDEYSAKILREIRNTRISLNEMQKAEAKNTYGKGWNKNFMGKVTLADGATSLDSQWKEWAREYPNIFDKDVNSNDMPGELLNVIDKLNEAKNIVQEFNKTELVNEVAEEIYNKFWTITPITTTADKYANKIKLLKLEHRRAMEQAKADYEALVEEQKLADEIHFKKTIAQIRERRDRDVKLAKEHGKAMVEGFKESAERKSVIQSLTSTVMSLNKKLTTNSKDIHIPDSLKPVVIDFINAIDFSSKQLLGMKGTKKDNRYIASKADINNEKALSKVHGMRTETNQLKRAVMEAKKLFDKAGQVIAEDKGTDADTSLVALDSETVGKIDKLIEKIDDLEAKGITEYVLQKMDTESLKTLKDMAVNINHWAIVADKALASKHKARISELGAKTIEDNEVLKKKANYNKAIESVFGMFNWRNTLPLIAFERFGNTAKQVFESLMDSQDTYTFNRQEIMNFTDKLLEKHDVKSWRKDIKSFELKLPNGDKKTIEMPVSFIMSLYCTAKQEDAQRHLYGEDASGGGITISSFKKGELKAGGDDNNTVLSEKLVNQITSGLSKEQREVADALQKFMGEKGSKWGDSVSMALYGIKKFGVKDYFPLKVSPNEIEVQVDNTSRASFYNILNYSFTKDRVPGATQSIVIGDIFETFANHMNMMAVYNAYALSMYDIMRWYNFRYVTDKGQRKSVRGAIGDAFGKRATEYISNLLRDLNGQSNSSRLEFVDGILKNTKISMVGASVSVVALQPTAYIRAMGEISPVYLMKSLGYIKDFGARRGIERAKEWCGIALLKSQGYFELGVSPNTTKQLIHDATVKEDIAEYSLKPAEWADELTWGMLWNACEFEIKAKRKDIKVGSEEYFNAVAERLREIIYKTQVVDSPLTKTDLMRSPDSRAKQWTMFGGEMATAYNQFYEAFFNISLDIQRNGRKGALKRNGKKIVTSLTAYTLTNALAALAETVIQAFRDDDDEDKDFEEYLKQYFSNFILDQLVVGKVPYLKETLNYYQGFSSETAETKWIADAFDAAKYWWKVLEGDDEKIEKAVKKTLSSTSYLSGTPAYNIYRDVKALYNLLFD